MNIRKISGFVIALVSGIVLFFACQTQQELVQKSPNNINFDSIPYPNISDYGFFVGELANLEPNELKEPPMDAADFTKKLLKVVEHVILLEKEVANLKAQKEQSAATPPVQIEPLRIETPQEETSSSSNPPVMPV